MIEYLPYNYWKHLAKESYVNSMMPDIVPLGIPEISDPSHSLPAITSDASRHDSGELCDSQVNPVSISLGDIRIEIGSGASDDMISGIIKAVRYA